MIAALLAFAWLHVTVQWPLYIADGHGKEIFHMESGACLRGPMVFYTPEGVEVWRLGAGTYYPAGCGK